MAYYREPVWLKLFLYILFTFLTFLLLFLLYALVFEYDRFFKVVRKLWS